MQIDWQQLQNFFITILPGADLIPLALAALLLDSILGGRKIFGRIPGPDHIFHSILHVICHLLDHDKYGPIRRVLRGLLVLATGLILLIPLGLWADTQIKESLGGHIVGILLLMLVFGQKTVRDHAKDLVAMLNDPTHDKDASRYGAARWGIERLTLRMADGMIANGFILMISGIWGLLTYRFIVMLVAVGSPKGILQPASPFYRVAWWLYELLTILPALFSCVLTFAAALFYKVARINLTKAFFSNVPNSILSRQLPLMAVAHAMGFSFLKGTGQGDVGDKWFGPRGGRDELTADDLANALHLALIIWIIELISLAAVAFLLWYCGAYTILH